jgi:predicted nucleic-acid-binding protein
VIALDTNVLVRFFAKDDPHQSQAARAFLGSLTSDQPGWIGVATILELVWVMSSQFRVGRAGIEEMLDRLLSREEIRIEQSETLEGSLQLFRSGRADFADCLIACSARAAGCTKTVTFDRIAARDAGMELLV